MPSKTRRSSADAGRVATVLETMIARVQELGLDAEGLYRVSGAATAVRALHSKAKAALGSSHGKKDLAKALAKATSVHVVTTALKQFLREATVPVIPFNAAEAFLRVAQLPSREERAAAVVAVVRNLPVASRRALAVLKIHAHAVAKQEPANKMSLQNLVLLFAPNLVRRETESTSLHDSLADVPPQLSVTSVLFSDDRDVDDALGIARPLLRDPNDSEQPYGRIDEEILARPKSGLLFADSVETAGEFEMHTATPVAVTAAAAHIEPPPPPAPASAGETVRAAPGAGDLLEPRPLVAAGDAAAAEVRPDATPSRLLQPKPSSEHFQRVRSYPKAKPAPSGSANSARPPDAAGAAAGAAAAGAAYDPARDPEVAFALFDGDGDGRLDADEVVCLVRSHGCLASVARLRELFARADPAGFGAVSFHEFSAVFGPRGEAAGAGAPPPVRCADAFAALDPGGTGRLSADEVAHLCATYGGADRMDAAAVRELLDELRIDEAGGLDYVALARELDVA